MKLVKFEGLGKNIRMYFYFFNEYFLRYVGLNIILDIGYLEISKKGKD